MYDILYNIQNIANICNNYKWSMIFKTSDCFVYLKLTCCWKISKTSIKKNKPGISVSSVVRILLPLQGAWVQALVGEQKSCMTRGQKRNQIHVCWRYRVVRTGVNKLIEVMDMFFFLSWFHRCAYMCMYIYIYVYTPIYKLCTF